MNRARPRVFRALLLAPILISLSMASVILVSAAEFEVESEGRVLGDYRFVPITQVPEPFIVSTFSGITTLSAAFDVNAPILILDTTPPDTLLNLEGNLLYVLIEYDYQLVVHPRIALRINGTGGTRVGTDEQSMLAQGVIALVDAEFGALAEIWRSDAMLLSGDLSIGYSRNLAIDFLQFAEEVIEKGIDDASLLSKQKGALVEGGLRYAWALNNWSGLNAIGIMGWAENTISDKNPLYWFGAGWSCDLKQRGRRPLGLAANFAVTNSDVQISSSSASYSLGLGLHYTGRDDLNLGFELSSSSLPLDEWDLTIYPVTFRIAFRYYF